MKTIGITIGVKENNESLWINGIKLNALYVAKLLKNSGKYNVILLNTTKKEFNEFQWDTEEFPTYHVSDMLDSIDLLICLGGQIDEKQTEFLKKKNVKIISYKCGDEYVIRMEDVIFNKNPESNKNIRIWSNPYYDQIWTVPQIFEHNYYFFKQFHKNENVKSVPFIWDSFLLDSYNEIQDLEYKPTNSPKRIAIMEPNQNVLKYAMYPLLITNHVYKERPDLIDRLYVNNTGNIKENKLFIEYVSQLDIVKDKKATFEGKFQTNLFLYKYADMVVSHQWENPLNYFYFDVVYFGHALLHNAHMCKELGYYYDRFNGDMGKDKLIWILENHDKNLDEYKNINRKILYNYSASNEKNIEFYVNEIEKLIN